MPGSGSKWRRRSDRNLQCQFIAVNPSLAPLLPRQCPTNYTCFPTNTVSAITFLIPPQQYTEALMPRGISRHFVGRIRIEFEVTRLVETSGNAHVLQSCIGLLKFLRAGWHFSPNASILLEYTASHCNQPHNGLILRERG